MIESEVDRFFSVAMERHNMFLKKERGEPQPWTEDSVLGRFRFCNVYRELDKTTQWFRKNVRDPLRENTKDVLFATVAFRWFNRIETGEIIHEELLNGPDLWDLQAVRDKLKDEKPIITGAYVIKTPPGLTKLDGVLWDIEQVRLDMSGLVSWVESVPRNERKMEDIWTRLLRYNDIGDFMAYQLVADLQYTCVLDQSVDRNTWAAPGPGSTRGLGWLVAGNPEHFDKNSKKACREMIPLMQQLLQKAWLVWPAEWTNWDMSVVQNWLCEIDKWHRGMRGQELKRLYKP